MAITDQIVASGRRAAPRTAPRGASRPQAIVPLFFAFLALPSGLAIKIFDATLYPARMFVLAMIPFALGKLMRDRSARFLPSDFFIVSFALWLWLSIIVNHQLGKGLYFGGSLAVEAVGAYLIARAYVRTFADFARATAAYFTTVLVAVAIAVPEALIGYSFAHEIASMVMGGEAPVWIKVSYASMYRRLGLMRPFSTFDHPILYGTFCAGATALVYFMYQGAQKWWRLLVIAFAVFMSLSSGPYIAFLLAVVLCVWERLTRRMAHRVLISGTVVSAGYLLVSLISNRGVLSIILASTLDPASGYYRLSIWEYGSAAVARSPWFGVAFDGWSRPSWMSQSVDNFWLNIGLLGGVPTVGALLLAIAFMLLGVFLRTPSRESRSRLMARNGWTVTVIVIGVQGLTVHYWGQLFMFFLFVIGLGAWMADTREGDAAPAQSGMQPRLGGRTMAPTRMEPRIGRLHTRN